MNNRRVHISAGQEINATTQQQQRIASRTRRPGDFAFFFEFCTFRVFLKCRKHEKGAFAEKETKITGTTRTTYDAEMFKKLYVPLKTTAIDVEFLAKLCAIEPRLSVLEQLLLRLYELMRNVHHQPLPIR